jgi:hypothetical protein
MKRAHGLLASIFLALPLAGCGGSAAPAAPFTQLPAPSLGQAQRERALDVGQDFGSNSFPHILVVAEAPGSLSKPLADGHSITLVASATDSKGKPISLSGAKITWSIPARGTIDPSQSGQTAVYTAPMMGEGHVVETVSVKLSGESQTYSANATIDFQRG